MLYFWTVAKTGSITRAGEELRLAQPTISAQLRGFEENLGEKLFLRRGRQLELTEAGQVVFAYADEIFSLGRELSDVLKGRPGERPAKLSVGISDVIPKLVAYRILQPALEMNVPLHLMCHEDHSETLLLQLATHKLDLVISDTPAPSSLRVKVFSHHLGSSALALYGNPSLVARYRRNFPAKLDGAPFLMPMRDSAFRQVLEQWLDAHAIRPVVVGEFQDHALLSAFGQFGVGLFAAPVVVDDEIRRYHRVSLIGRLDSATEDFYAISVERKIKHPAVAAISDSARRRLFTDHRSSN